MRNLDRLYDYAHRVQSITIGGSFLLRWKRTCLLLLTCLTVRARTLAQDLEPRVYSASPVGTTFLGVSFGRSSGDVTFDPAIPITNVNASLYSPTLAISHTFSLFHRQTLFSGGFPYVWGNVTGDVGTQSGKVYRSGLGDLRLRYSINLHGSPAMSVKEFAHRQRGYILAASLTAQVPSGQYGNTSSLTSEQIAGHSNQNLDSPIRLKSWTLIYMQVPGFLQITLRSIRATAIAHNYHLPLCRRT